MKRALCSLVLAVSALAQEPAPGTPDQASAEPTIRVDVDLVNIFYTVKTKKGGQLIPGLEQKDFQIFEDGKEQKILHFSRETDLPLTLGLLIDISASQERLIDIEREAASQFFSSVIRPKDEAFLISFGKDTELLQDYTNSARQLTAAMRDLKGDGQDPRIANNPIPVNTGPIPQSGDPKGTLLFDAVCLASKEKLKSEVGRKALILITDGGDQGSTYRIQDAIESAQRSDAIVYSIYYVDRGFYMGGGMMFGDNGEGNLEKMSAQTGGHVFKVDKKHPLSEVFKEIQDELRNQYSIGYTPIKTSRDDTFRHIEIKVDNPDDKVQARAGYYASKPDAQ
jgi:VWFA-related protein